MTCLLCWTLSTIKICLVDSSHTQSCVCLVPSQESWQPGTEVVALYNFKGNSKEDLPFSKREVLVIVKSTRVSTHYTLHITHYTLHITHYTLHITHYTLHITHYTLHITCQVNSGEYTHKNYTLHITCQVNSGEYTQKTTYYTLHITMTHQHTFSDSYLLNLVTLST